MNNRFILCIYNVLSVRVDAIKLALVCKDNKIEEARQIKARDGWIYHEIRLITRWDEMQLNLYLHKLSKLGDDDWS